MKKFFATILLTAFFVPFTVAQPSGSPPEIIRIQVPTFCVYDVQVTIKIFRDWQQKRPKDDLLAEINSIIDNNTIAPEVVKFIKSMVEFIYTRPSQNQEDLPQIVDAVVDRCIMINSPEPTAQEWKASSSTVRRTIYK